MLNAVPSLEGVGGGPAEGSRSFAPTQDTRFILEVPGLLKSAQREWDVTVVPSQSSRLLGGVAQCEGSPPIGVYIVFYSAKRFVFTNSGEYQSKIIITGRSR